MQPITPRTDTSQRDRPMQKSMFLSTQQSPAPISKYIETHSLNSLKRSSMPIIESSSATIAAGFHYLPNHTNLQRAKVHQQVNFLPPHATNRPPSYYEVSDVVRSPYHDKATIETSLQGQRMGNPTKSQEKATGAEQIVQMGHRSKSKGEAERLLAEDISQLKKKLEDQINAVRGEIRNFRVEWMSQKSQFKKELIAEVGRIVESSDKFLNPISLKLRKEVQHQDWPKQINALHQKIHLLENSLQDRLQQIVLQVEKLALAGPPQQQAPALRSSLLQSSLPPILLEYRELLVVKPPRDCEEDNHTCELVVTEESYFVDNQGFLLDNERRYLLNERDQQIRLGEKHLELLAEHGILAK